jgi:HPt (histidine-containing phosphotransfer) domain-containing protein
MDLARAIESVGGNRALLGELVEIFLNDLPMQLQTLRAGARGGDSREAERIAHSLKSSLAILGAPTAARLAAELEGAWRDARTEVASGLLGELEVELSRLQAFLARPDWLAGA